jgi:hypothetical protein
LIEEDDERERPTRRCFPSIELASARALDEAREPLTNLAIDGVSALEPELFFRFDLLFGRWARRKPVRQHILDLLHGTFPLSAFSDLADPRRQ